MEGGNEIGRKSGLVVQYEGFSVYDGLSVRVRRAVYSRFRIAFRQFVCISRGVHMLSGTYRWVSKPAYPFGRGLG